MLLAWRGGVIALWAAFLFLISGLAHAEAYPSKLVRFIYPGPPGSVGDMLTRSIGEELAKSWGQAVIVDNRTGAGGIIGSSTAAKAAPDGYTILMGHAGSHAISVALQPRMPYHPLRDFAPVTLVATGPNVVLVHPSLPVTSVKALIAFAKARPSEINYGSGGVGLSNHLAGELFKRMAGVDMVHVPYQGLPAAVIGLITGEVSVMFVNIALALPQINAKKVRALAVTSAKRSLILPELPTVAEAALPGYEAIAWFGVFTPANTPKEIVAKISSDIARVLNLAEINIFILRQGLEPVSSTPKQFVAYIRSDIDKWTQVIREAGIRLNP